MTTGGLRVTTIGTWSDPIHRRGVSQEDTKGVRGEFAKARSSTQFLVIASKGKRV